MSDLKLRVIQEITKKTKRDKQHRVGPSELGNPCPHCLGRALAGERGERDFSLYPWLGTAVHAYLEAKTFPNDYHELRLTVGEVPGYGEVSGTTDMLLEDEGKLIVLDWKIVGLKKIKEYKAKGVPKQYRYQVQLYARGCELAGHAIDSVAICFIPRDSGEINDIWVYEEAYQPEMAEKALERAGLIYAHVQEHGWEDLASDPDCWNCKLSWR